MNKRRLCKTLKFVTYFIYEHSSTYSLQFIYEQDKSPISLIFVPAALGFLFCTLCFPLTFPSLWGNSVEGNLHHLEVFPLLWISQFSWWVGWFKPLLCSSAWGWCCFSLFDFNLILFYYFMFCCLFICFQQGEYFNLFGSSMRLI